ncbi:hypothetical protein LTR08_000800 [Meristemomyces frigidus]|nr:hypothetical protein LTR08_000800 [Meristemomyces frigidus]
MIGFKSFICALGLSALVDAQISLATGGNYGVFAATTITNTGLTVINAPIGLTPGTSITGFPPGINGGEDVNDAAATQAKTDIQNAYNAILALAVTEDLTGTDLGGLTLTPGVYGFSSSGGLTGILTLDAQGDPDAQFIFKFGSTLTTATASSVVLVNDASACNVFWQVGSSATLGTATLFQGNVIAQASITATTGVSVARGGLYALAAAVTLDTNLVDTLGACGGSVASAPTTSSALPSTTSPPTTPAPSTVTLTSTATYTDQASTTTITVTDASTVTVYQTVAQAIASCTSTTTQWSTKSATKTASPTACPTAKALAKRAKASTKTKTVTSTCAGHTSTHTVKPAQSTHTVKTTHTSTSTHWVTSKATTSVTSTKTPACTAKAKRDYLRMFE